MADEDEAEALDTEAALEAIKSYREWSKRLNKIQSEQIANTAQSRLRVRALQALSQGAEPDRVSKLLSDDFSNYTESQLDTVVRTTVSDYFASARYSAYEAAGNFVRGVRFVTVEDDHRTPFCTAIDGRSISKDDDLYEKIVPPFWYACRTMPVPVLATDAAWAFDDDWAEWLDEHAEDDGGGFLAGVA